MLRNCFTGLLLLWIPCGCSSRYPGTRPAGAREAARAAMPAAVTLRKSRRVIMSGSWSVTSGLFNHSSGAVHVPGGHMLEQARLHRHSFDIRIEEQLISFVIFSLIVERINQNFTFALFGRDLYPPIPFSLRCLAGRGAPLLRQYHVNDSAKGNCEISRHPHPDKTMLLSANDP